MKRGEDPYMQDFRKGIRLLIAEDGVATKKSVALSAGLSEAYITRFLSEGQGLNPRLASLSAIAQSFDMQIEDVVRYARACNVARVQLIAGGQENVIKDLLYFRGLES